MKSAETAHRERLDAAVRLVDAGRLREAEDVFRYLLREIPDDPDALCGLAGIAIARGEPQMGFDLLAQARERHSGHDGILAALGTAHNALGRPADAMICFDTAISIAPANPAHRLARLQLLLLQGHPDEALGDADKALGLAGEKADFLNARGTVLVALGRKQEGADMFRRAHEADPSRADAAHNLALALTALGRFEEAVPFAENAYLNEPGDPAYRVSLARRLMAVGRLEAARDVAQAAVAIAPADISASETLADCLVLTGEEDKGLAILANLTRRVKSSAESSLALARVLRLAGRLEQALGAASHARAAAPKDIRAVALEHDINLALGRYAVANGKAEQPPHSEPAIFSTKGVDPADAVFCARWLKPGTKLHTSAEESDLFGGLRNATLVDDPGADAPPLVELASEVAAGPVPAPVWTPYLHIADEKTARWKKAFEAWPSPHVGLIWQTTLPGARLDALHQTFRGFGTMISLGTGSLRHQLEGRADILDAGAHITGLADLAAAIAALDMVVTPDSVVAHLAGALGKPGVVLMPAGFPWQWRSENGRAVWYPTLEVVVQSRAGRWDEAIAEARRRAERLLPHSQTVELPE